MMTHCWDSRWRHWHSRVKLLNLRTIANLNMVKLPIFMLNLFITSSSWGFKTVKSWIGNIVINVKTAVLHQLSCTWLKQFLKYHFRVFPLQRGQPWDIFPLKLIYGFRTAIFWFFAIKVRLSESGIIQNWLI